MRKENSGELLRSLTRRDLVVMLSGVAVAWPHVGRAQPVIPVIGVLNSTMSSDGVGLMAPLLQGLAEQGYVVDRNVAIEYRWADGHYERLPDLAAELVRRPVSVIVAGGGLAPVQAAMAASATLPIVFTSGDDPVKAGIVASLNRPGGNITGVTVLTDQLGSKRLELLHELLPTARDLGVLVDANMQPQDLSAAAERLGITLHSLPIWSEDALDAAFAKLMQTGVAGVLLDHSPVFSGAWGPRVVALAANYALPAMHLDRRVVVAGGLASYGPDFSDAYHQAGLYVARILRGDKPANLPVVQSSKFQFVINLKTAKALGLTIPPTLLATADEVIE
jgi:putative ABC transport system substrate-binding protein